MMKYFYSKFVDSKCIEMYYKSVAYGADSAEIIDLKS